MVAGVTANASIRRWQATSGSAAMRSRIAKRVGSASALAMRMKRRSSMPILYRYFAAPRKGPHAHACISRLRDRRLGAIQAAMNELAHSAQQRPAASPRSYLDTLNESQRAAVEAIDGPVLV